MLNKIECLELHRKNNGKICYIDNLAINDYRMVLRNNDDILYTFMSSDYDTNEQAHVARLCQAINNQRNSFVNH